MATGLCCLVPVLELREPLAAQASGNFTLTWTFNHFPLTKISFFKKIQLLAGVEKARFTLLFFPAGPGASILVLVR